MSRVTRKSITISTQLVKYAETRVAAGDYVSIAEVLNDALRKHRQAHKVNSMDHLIKELEDLRSITRRHTNDLRAIQASLPDDEEETTK